MARPRAIRAGARREARPSSSSSSRRRSRSSRPAATASRSSRSTSERRAVFVRGAAPGDRVRLAVDRARRPARGRVLALLAAGAERVRRPRAPGARSCGGCDWMHLSARGQRAAHEAHVRGALPRAWREPAPIASHPAPSPLRLPHAGARPRPCVRGRAIVGMNEARTRDPVEVASVRRAPSGPRGGTRAARVPPRGAHGRGEVQIALGRGASPRRPSSTCTGAARSPPVCFATPRAARSQEGGSRARGSRPARRACRRRSAIRRRGSRRRRRPAPPRAGRLRAGVGRRKRAPRAPRRRARPRALAGKTRRPRRRALRGSGQLHRAPRARDREQLVAVESAREACDAARANLEARGLAARAGSSKRTRPRSPFRRALTWSCSILRAAGRASVCARLAASSAKHVVYVSCDSADPRARSGAPRSVVRASRRRDLRAVPPDEPRRDRRSSRAAPDVRTPVDARLAAEAARFAFRFACDDCVHFASRARADLRPRLAASLRRSALDPPPDRAPPSASAKSSSSPDAPARIPPHLLALTARDHPRGAPHRAR